MLRLSEAIYDSSTVAGPYSYRIPVHMNELLHSKRRVDCTVIVHSSVAVPLCIFSGNAPMQ